MSAKEKAEITFKLGSALTALNEAYKIHNTYCSSSDEDTPLKQIIEAQASVANAIALTNLVVEIKK